MDQRFGLGLLVVSQGTYLVLKVLLISTVYSKLSYYTGPTTSRMMLIYILCSLTIPLCTIYLAYNRCLLLVCAAVLIDPLKSCFFPKLITNMNSNVKISCRTMEGVGRIHDRRDGLLLYHETKYKVLKTELSVFRPENVCTEMLIE